jgi:hypothetical protein
VWRETEYIITHDNSFTLTDLDRPVHVEAEIVNQGKNDQPARSVAPPI